MKSHLSLLFISFLCLASLNAQEMNIYLNDNTKASFPLSKNPVSSITDGTLQVKVGNFVKEFPLKDVKECKVEYNDANPELAKYDYNYDRVIDVQDINALVDYLLTQEPSEEFSIQKLTELINHIITSKDNEEDASNILFDVSESTDLGPAYYWGYKMMQGCTTFRDRKRDIVVTSVVGTNWYANWNDKTTDPIRAAYYVIKPINNK